MKLSSSEIISPPSAQFNNFSMQTYSLWNYFAWFNVINNIAAASIIILILFSIEKFSSIFISILVPKGETTIIALIFSFISEIFALTFPYLNTNH